MATGLESNRCLTCEKNGAKSMCTGCQQFFCVKHFIEHRHHLSIQFDHDIVRSHDELLEQINQMKLSDNSFADLFSQIDRWEKATIEKIHKTAENARHQLTELLNSEREILAEKFRALTKEIRRQREEENFAEDDIKHLGEQIHRLQKSFEQLTRSHEGKMIIVENDQIDWNRLIYAQTTRELELPRDFDFAANTKWTQNGITVAGGHSSGNGLNQLSSPQGLYVDDDETLYIADQCNHRIVEWKPGATSGRVIAGGNGQGYRNDQLNSPIDVIVDKETDSLIISDLGNRRVVQWPRRTGTNGNTIISNIKCFSLTMTDDRFLYVCDYEKHEVRRWRVGETQGILVAGGNGRGHRLDQLNLPRCVFVDRHHSVFVSDNNNHRVVKWVKEGKEGIVVAGGQGRGNTLTQLSYPADVFVDPSGVVYVVEHGNHRIMRWPEGATQGSIVVGGNDRGGQANQFNGPVDLSFDRHGNLYVSDHYNHRVQNFSLDRSSCS